MDLIVSVPELLLFYNDVVLKKLNTKMLSETTSTVSNMSDFYMIRLPKVIILPYPLHLPHLVRYYFFLFSEIKSLRRWTIYRSSLALGSAVYTS